MEENIRNLRKGFLFRFFRIVISLVNYILLRIFHAKPEEPSVYKILMRSVSDLFAACEDDFVSVYVGTIDLDTILQKDRISLYKVTEQSAMFVCCEGADVFDTQTNPFVYKAQYKYAKQVIIIPMKPFHDVSLILMKRLTKHANFQIVHAANHSRCGSTLLATVFSQVPGVLSISETQAFADLCEFSRLAQFTGPELRRVCLSIMACSIKHAVTRNSKLVLIKPQSMSLFVADLMLEAIPDSNVIYLYRQPIPYVLSWQKLYHVNNWPHSVFRENLQMLAGLGHNKILAEYPRYSQQFIDGLHFFSHVSLQWISSQVAYRKLLQSNDIKSIKFEDLISHPEKVVEKLFSHLGLKADVEHACSVLKMDSQAGTLFSSRHANNNALEDVFTPITERIRKEIETFCENFRFSSATFWGVVDLPNNILKD